MHQQICKAMLAAALLLVGPPKPDRFWAKCRTKIPRSTMQ